MVKSKQVGVSLPIPAVEWIESMAEDKGISVSKALFMVVMGASERRKVE